MQPGFWFVREILDGMVAVDVVTARFCNNPVKYFMLLRGVPLLQKHVAMKTFKSIYKNSDLKWKHPGLWDPSLRIGLYIYCYLFEYQYINILYTGDTSHQLTIIFLLYPFELSTWYKYQQGIPPPPTVQTVPTLPPPPVVSSLLSPLLSLSSDLFGHQLSRTTS